MDAKTRSIRPLQPGATAVGILPVLVTLFFHHGFLNWTIKQAGKPVKWAAKTTVNKAVKPVATAVVAHELTQNLPIKVNK